MKKVLIDASSAILLAKAGLFFRVIRFYDVRMVPRVYGEITPPGRPFSRLFTRCLKQGGIGLVQPLNAGSAPPCNPTPQLSRLHPGEYETLLRFFDGEEDLIIIDDGKGAKYCRVNQIPYLNALLCPKILFLAGRLNQQCFERVTHHLIRVGRYAAWVVETAASLSQEELTGFLG